MQMKTILFITSSKMRNGKGTERFIYYLCQGLENLNLRAVILENSTSKFNEPDVKFNMDSNIEIVSVPFRRVLGIYFPPRNEIYKINPDVVYTSFLNTMPFVPDHKYITIFGMHILHIGHLKYEPKRKNLIFAIKRLILKLISSISWKNKKIIFHALTDEQASWINKLTNMKYNCTTIPLLLPCHKNYKITMDYDKFNILFFGSLSHEKGFDNFLILIEKLNCSSIAEGIKFIVAGGGIMESNLRRYMEKYSNIDFIKRPDDDVKLNLFSKIDLFLYPSLTDVYPTILAETQIFGIPAIASDVSAPSHIIKEGETGFFLPLYDLEAFVDKTEEYYFIWKNNIEGYERMKVCIRDLSKRLCLDHVLPLYIDVFKNILI